MNLIDKDAVLAEIHKLIDEVYDGKTFDSLGKGRQVLLFYLKSVVSSINNLEVKEVDLELITGWFDHIAQIADDRMTLTNQRMTDAHALDEIKCLAKNSSEFITKHYKAQKGEKA